MASDKIIEGVKITNPDKIIHGKYKKIDVVQYYNDISSLILPFLANRPLSTIRCPQGTQGECFFKKHPSQERGQVEIINDEDKEYFYVKNKKQLIFQVQIGSIEFHPWLSSVKNIEKPDMMIFDLDPGEDVSLGKLRKAVLLLKDMLSDLGLATFLKTSGGKGYHILIPFASCKNWDSLANFAKQVAVILEEKYPHVFTSNIRKEKRHGKIFVDWLRNGKGATCVAPYSLRARDNLPISFPLAWEELGKIKPNQINIANYKKYLTENPWHDFWLVKQKLK